MNSIARAEARIKQLCCLGLPSEAIIPPVLRELHALVPSYHSNFFWIDNRDQITNVYQENFDETAPGDRRGARRGYPDPSGRRLAGGNLLP